MRSFLLFLLVSILAAGGPVMSTGCGGCPPDEVDMLATTPATSCLQLTATLGSICGGLNITVSNQCSEALALPQGTVAPGGALELQAFEVCGTIGPCSVAGMLGTSSVVISWVVRDR